MHLHEYQATQLFCEYGIAVAQGRLLESADEAAGLAGLLSGPAWLVKARIHAGLLEINPLVVTEAGELVALDARMDLDDNAAAGLDMIAQSSLAVETASDLTGARISALEAAGETVVPSPAAIGVGMQAAMSR